MTSEWGGQGLGCTQLHWSHQETFLWLQWELGRVYHICS